MGSSWFSSPLSSMRTNCCRVPALVSSVHRSKCTTRRCFRDAQATPSARPPPSHAGLVVPRGTRSEVRLIHPRLSTQLVCQGLCLCARLCCSLRGSAAPRLRGSAAPRLLRSCAAARLRGCEAARLRGCAAPPRLRGSSAAPRLRGCATPRLRDSADPRLRGSAAPRLLRDCAAPRLRDSAAPQLRGSAAPRLLGSAAPRLRGSAAPRLRGSEAPQLRENGGFHSERIGPTAILRPFPKEHPPCGTQIRRGLCARHRSGALCGSRAPLLASSHGANRLSSGVDILLRPMNRSTMVLITPMNRRVGTTTTTTTTTTTFFETTRRR